MPSIDSDSVHFVRNFTLIVDRLFDSRLDYNIDAKFESTAIAKTSWVFLVKNIQRKPEMIQYYLNGISNEVKCMLSNTWTAGDFIRLPRGQTGAGVYGAIVFADSKCGGYVGSAAGVDGFKGRWSGHSSELRKGLQSHLDKKESRPKERPYHIPVLYKFGSQPGAKSCFRMLASFPLEEIRAERMPWMLLLETVFMIYMNTYLSDGRGCTESLELAQSSRPSTCGATPWSEGLNRALPLKQGVMLEGAWHREEDEVVWHYVLAAEVPKKCHKKLTALGWIRTLGAVCCRFVMHRKWLRTNHKIKIGRWERRLERSVGAIGDGCFGVLSFETTGGSWSTCDSDYSWTDEDGTVWTL